MQLQSFVAGKWQTGAGDFVTLRDATTNEVIGSASALGVDFRAMLWNARHVGGPNLRELTFHERAGLLKSLAKMLM
jgi:oxepin-CoA hydrolase/3-oxo-5,6-dehydrosuberyl-CoA semialdehyde dehydrogenase